MPCAKREETVQKRKKEKRFQKKVAIVIILKSNNRYLFYDVKSGQSGLVVHGLSPFWSFGEV